MAKLGKTPQTEIKVGVKRTCDMCPRRYTPVTKKHRFCSDTCRADFHKFGPTLLRLRDRIAREVSLQGPEWIYAVWLALDQHTRNRFPPAMRSEFEKREAEGK